jgi:hypothetical protein
VVLLFDTELLLNEKPCAQIKWRSPRKKKLQGAQAKEMRVVSQKVSYQVFTKMKKAIIIRGVFSIVQ